MTEAQQLYNVFCLAREMGCGGTSAQHMIEALHFLDGTARLTLINLHEVISGRVKHVARDLYEEAADSSTSARFGGAYDSAW